MLKINGRRFCTTDLTSVEGGGGLEAVQIGFPNSRYVQPNENLAAAYSWLKSTACDGSMGTLSATNPRYLVLLPGVHDITSVSDGAGSDTAARTAYDTIFSETNCRIVPFNGAISDTTILKINSNVVNIPQMLDKVCSGVFVQMGDYPAVPTFGYYPPQWAQTHAGTPCVPRDMERVLAVPASEWTIERNYAADADVDPDSRAEPKAKRVTAAAGQTDACLTWTVPAGTDLSDCHFKLKFRIDQDAVNPDAIQYFEAVFFYASDTMSAKFSFWGPQSCTYFRPQGWFEVSLHQGCLAAISEGFDWAQVARIRLRMAKTSAGSPAFLMDRFEAYRGRCQAFTPVVPASGRSLHVTGGTGATPGWYAVTKQDAGQVTSATAVASGDAEDITADCYGLALNVTGVDWNSTSRTLTKTGAFASYVGKWRPGDCVYISAGTDALTGWHGIDPANITADAIRLIQTPSSGTPSNMTITMIGQPVALANGQYKATSKQLIAPAVNKPQQALYMLDFDDAFASSEPAVLYALSKGIVPNLYVFGKVIDNETPGYMTLDTLQRLHKAGARICNHSYQHWVDRYYYRYVTADSTTQLADVLRQKWWMYKHGFGGRGAGIFAVPGGGHIGGDGVEAMDNQWWSVCDFIRYTMSPTYRWTTSLDVPGNFITCGDNVNTVATGNLTANAALSAALRWNGLCHVLFHKFLPDSGGVNLTDFKAHIDAVAECVRAGAIRVVTPFDLLGGN